MNIYIYGDSSFKKAMHTALEHANVKLRLDGYGSIEDISSVEVLKMVMQDNPDDIYLVDQSKIIQKGSLEAKIGFLRPKDGIEQEFLEQCGIGNARADNLEDIGRHIVKKLDSLHLNKLLDSTEEVVVEAKPKPEYLRYDSKVDMSNAHIFDKEETLAHNVHQDFEDNDQLLDNLDNQDIQTSRHVMDDFDITQLDNLDDDLLPKRNINFNLDEDLDGLLVLEDDEQSPKTTYNDDILDLKFDESLIPKPTIKVEDNKMAAEVDLLKELDAISEDDMMAALSGAEIPHTTPSISSTKQITPKQSSNQSSIVGSASNFGDIGALISELLKNKTLEITIKIKE